MVPRHWVRRKLCCLPFEKEQSAARLFLLCSISFSNEIEHSFFIAIISVAAERHGFNN